MISAVTFIFPLLDAIVGVFLKEVLESSLRLAPSRLAKFPLLPKSRHATRPPSFRTGDQGHKRMLECINLVLRHSIERSQYFYE